MPHDTTMDNPFWLGDDNVLEGGASHCLSDLCAETLNYFATYTSEISIFGFGRDVCSPRANIFNN